VRLSAKDVPCLMVGDLDIYLKVSEILELMDEKNMPLLNGVSKGRGSAINLDMFWAS
jgi:hypothetical protein